MAKSMTHPTARKKKGVQASNIAERRKRVWQLRVEGHSYQGIADLVGVSKAAVQEDIKACFAELKEETLQEAEHYRSIQLQRLEALMTKYFPIAYDPGHPDFLQATDRLIKIESQIAKLMGTEELPVQRTEEISDKPMAIKLDFSGIPGLKDEDDG